MATCLFCDSQLTWYERKFCSNRCQAEYRYQLYIKDWKLGLKSGSRGVITKNISGHLRRYLTEKFGEKCVLCGWNKRNLATNNVPLEIDHIDGNADNNVEENLRLICPNCHSLSTNFRNLNKGHGRKWRGRKQLKP